MGDATLAEVTEEFGGLTASARYRVPSDRKATIATVIDRVESKRDELIQETVTETGIPRAHLRAEFDAAINGTERIPAVFERYASFLKTLGTAYGVEYTLVPKGRVLVFAPWNSPMLSQIFLPCLSYYAGNPTILKPSSRANAVSEVVIDALCAASDPHVSRTRRLTAAGTTVSTALRTDWIDYVYYMGSREVGMEIRSAFNGEFFGEYEGNNIALLETISTATIDCLIDSIVEKNGIDCDNLRGIFVPESAFAETVSRLRERSAELTVGDPQDPNTDISAVLSDGLSIVQNPSTSTMATPTMNPELWVAPAPNGLKATVQSFFEISPYGLSTLLLSGNPDPYINFLQAETPTTRICVNKPLLEFTPHAPWGGRGHTADDGVRSWVEKFTDTVVVDRDTSAAL